MLKEDEMGFRAVLIIMGWLCAMLMILSTCSAVRAEGLIYTPNGWRAAPCCRDQGYPGLQRVPPWQFSHGPLARDFWGAIAREFAPYGYGGGGDFIIPQVVIPTWPPQRPRSYNPPPRQYLPPRAQAPIPYEQEPVPEETMPQEMPPPPDLPPGQPDNRFLEFCQANPAAPPCRNRFRGQR